VSRKRITGAASWVTDELARAAQTAREINADAETTQRVNTMWKRAANASLVSSAESYRIGDPPTGRLIRPNNSDGWEAECWQMYDNVGELHYVAGQNGRSVAQARLYIAQYDDDGIPREVTKGEAASMSRDLLGGETLSADLKWALGVQGMISGQSLITVSDSDGWEVFSDQDFRIDKQEIKKASEKGVSPYLVDRGGARKERLPKGTLVIHLWDRHPGRAWQVDSSTRPAIPYLRELCRLDQYVQSTLLSRIATAGILQVPQQAQTMAPPSVQVPDGMDPLMHMLATVGQANISDPGSAAAILPVLISMPPGESLEHIKLDYDLTPVVNEFREMNLKRVAMSMDMAPETMTGFSGVKYSNAEFIQSESIRTHVVRRVAAIASALTRCYVRPALGSEYLVRWDLSDLEIQPDRTQAALDLYDRLEIDGETLRLEAGLRKGTPPEGRELLRRLAINAVRENPELLATYAPLLGIEAPIHVHSEPATDTPEVDDTEGPAQIEQPSAGTPVVDDSPNTTPSPESPEPSSDTTTIPTSVVDTQPTPTPASAAPTPALEPSSPVVSHALVAACDVVVCGALGRAGAAWRKRQRSRVAATRGIDTQAIYLEHSLTADREPHETPHEHAEKLFGGNFAAVPRIAALYGANPSCLQATLCRYVTSLIVERKPHNLDRLADTIRECITEHAYAA
jgi:hypothetical protein